MNDIARSEPNIVSHGIERSHRFGPHRFAWVPLPAFFVAVIGLWFNDIKAPHESPGLLIALSILLTTVPALGVATLFARNFLITGAPGVALFGCGALFWGASGLSPSFAALTSFNANPIVTSHNLTVWGASLCYLAGAALLQRGSPALTHRGPVLLVAYALALAVAAFMGFMIFQEWAPVFFVQGKGASQERQFVLASTILAILQTLLLLRRGAKLRRSPFLDWFVLALLLLVIGYSGIMLQTMVGGVLGWVSRAAQYLGGGYMLVAAYVAFRDSEAPFVVRALSQEKAPHRYSVAIAIVLIAAVLRLVFLQALETHNAFITFYPAVMLAALYGGLRAGVLATFLAAALADYFWIEPAGSFIVTRPADWLGLAIFAINCLLVSWVVELLRNAQARLQRVEAERRAELERTIAERTAELDLAKTEAELANVAKSRLHLAATATEAELQAVFDAVPAGVWITRDPSCETMQGNRIGNAWMRIPEGTNASKSAPDPSILRFEVLDKDGLPVPTDQLPMQRAALGEEVIDYEFEWRFPDGESRSLYGNATPLRDEGGNVIGAVAAFIDVTERKRAEAALRESEERERVKRHELEAILEAIPAAVFIAEDPACARMTINHAGMELLRLSPDANASKSAPEGEAPQHFEVRSEGRILSPCELPLQRAAATKRMIEGAEFDLHFVDGDCKHFFGNALPLLDDEGAVRGAVGAFVDITDRKLAYDALRASEERFRGIFEHAATGISITDLEYRSLTCNPAYAAMLGYT
jgi:PAS domain-containing protein